MNKLITATLILISSNCFADLQYDLDKMEQERRLYQLENQIDDIQRKQSNDDAYKFYDDIQEKIRKVD